MPPSKAELEQIQAEMQARALTARPQQSRKSKASWVAIFLDTVQARKYMALQRTDKIIVEQVHRWLVSKLPTPEDMDAYEEDMEKKSAKFFARDFAHVPINKFLSAVETCDYNSEASRDKIHEVIDSKYAPFAHIGHCRGEYYDLDVGRDFFEPVDFDSIVASPPAIELEEIFLGINRDVEPKIGELLYEREDLPRASEREDVYATRAQHHGVMYVCLVLGRVLRHVGGDLEDSIRRGPNTEPMGQWRDTNFVLVVDVTSGRVGALYLIYNFAPEDDDLVRHRPKPGDPWGVLPKHTGPDERFTVACIAPNIGALGKDFEFSAFAWPNSVVRHAVELVGVGQAVHNGPLLRRSVA